MKERGEKWRDRGIDGWRKGGMDGMMEGGWKEKMKGLNKIPQTQKSSET